MSKEQPITEGDHWFVGEDKPFDYFVTTGADIESRDVALKGATSILVQPLVEDLLSGDKIRFGAGIDNGAGIIATLDANADKGDVVLSVSATPGRIDMSVLGGKIEDITTYTMEWVLRLGPTAEAFLLSKTVGSGITITDGPNGVVAVQIADTDTGDGSVPVIDPGDYFYTLRKTNAGDESVLAFGTAVLRLGATR